VVVVISDALLSKLRAPIEALCARHSVRELSLFGSAIREDFDATSSDIDVVASFEPPMGESLARQYFDFKQGLEDLFGRPVDVVELEAMPDTRLKRRIEQSRRVIYSVASGADAGTLRAFPAAGAEREVYDRQSQVERHHERTYS